MAKYIRAVEAAEKVAGTFKVQMADLVDIFAEIPTADVAPVVHGRWIEQEDTMLDTYYTCSACKEDFYIETTGYTEKDLFLYTFCPNCGAKMDGGNS